MDQRLTCANKMGTNSPDRKKNNDVNLIAYQYKGEIKWKVNTTCVLYV